ncbi:hypothetical protein [Streptomyces sp. NPDC058296]|uniref:hypothetical protein n=1 Tax=Streptomyces sp. NPDC058296 TaxID=3346432 RepID=UPI0036E5A815
MDLDGPGERRPDPAVRLSERGEPGPALDGSARPPWPERGWLLGAGERGLDGVTLEPQVDDDGLVLGELLVEVRQDRAEAWRIGRQLGHVFD